MIQAVPFERWASELERSALLCPAPQPRITVVNEVDSTQDEARRRNASPGEVIIAWRQTRGRGRLGRVWADTREDGVAMTMVVPRDRPERLAIASAVGVCTAIEDVLRSHTNRTYPLVGIKWPNDIVIDGRKVAGILIEQVEDRALIGIGINVHQRTWPVELKGAAISLAEVGTAVDRVEVIGAVIQSMLSHCHDPDDHLERLFHERDVLRGSIAGFVHNGREIHGRILRVDPLRGLAVQSDRGEVWLPAATTSVIGDGDR